MKIKVIIILCLFGFSGHKCLFGQQNLFNIPSGDVTPRGKVFFQQQINFYSHYRFTSKSHFVLGLGGNFEVGVNVVNSYFNFNRRPSFVISHPFNSREPYPYYPLLLFTGQKRVNLSENWFVNAGTQAGFNLYSEVNAKRFTHFSYGLLGYHRAGKFRLIAGPYLTDWRFVGGGNRMGIQAGAEVHLTKKLWFMADHISGSHKNSVTVAGLVYNVTPRFQLCGGWQLPNPRSAERQAFVLEINLFNF
ncbi:MAG: hypothetical protein MUC87_08335 [Bacteroidia bacterium]|jgi:hypothetical protein|nr:hypothetical protein [Bacteroidia bacterium]